MTFVGLALIMTYMCVLLIRTCETSTENCQKYGLGDTAHGVYLFFVFNGLAMLCLHLAIDAANLMNVILRETGTQSICVRGTGRPPELALREGQVYHLFLSHVWATGQVSSDERLLSFVL